MIVEEPNENYHTGWIKLFRSIQKKGWYSDSEYVHLWIHLLISANHKGKEFFFNGQIITLNEGQFVTGRKQLAAVTGIKESKIERILKCFESEQQIEQQTNSRNRVISIRSWNVYQKNEQQTDNKRTANEQLADTNKNDNNIINNTSLRSEQFEKFWKYYKKGSKKVSRERFMKLSELELELIKKHLPVYFKANPEIKYRKDAERYLSNKLWENDDIVELTKGLRLPDNWFNIDLEPQYWALLSAEQAERKKIQDAKRKIGI